jgi:hypothetical protein
MWLCLPAELHVLDGAAQTIFVRANYSMEVGGSFIFSKRSML